MTILLIMVNVLIFLIEFVLETQGTLRPIFVRFGFTPANFTADWVGTVPTMISSMFLHADWKHVLGNIWFLWIFGDNVEDRLGTGRFILFYLITGMMATIGQWAVYPDSTLPMIGASGAVSGILGAYLIEFPRARVTAAFLYFIRQVPAILAIGTWFLIQLVLGTLSLSAEADGTSGIAFFAHLGGFLAGVILMKPFQIGRRQPDVAGYLE